MPTATLPAITEDQIDDLLYLARTGETSELESALDVLAKDLSTTPSNLHATAVDPQSGNSLLHMASANGHTETLKSLLAVSSSTNALNLNLQNSSGNTPLHWAALNGHLNTVKVLLEAGADVTICNGRGHDAIYEAEVNEKREVVEWLLGSRQEVERAVVGVREEEGQAEEVRGAEREREINDEEIIKEGEEDGEG